MRIPLAILAVLVAIWALAPHFVPTVHPTLPPRVGDAIDPPRLAELVAGAPQAVPLDRARRLRGPLIDPATHAPLTGLVAERSPDGSLAMIAEVRNGVPHGAAVGLHPDGSLAWVRHHARGRPFGRVLEFDTVGELRLDAIAGGEHPRGGPRLEAVVGPIVPGANGRPGHGARVVGFDWHRALSDADVRADLDDRRLHAPKEPTPPLQ